MEEGPRVVPEAAAPLAAFVEGRCEAALAITAAAAVSPMTLERLGWTSAEALLLPLLLAAVSVGAVDGWGCGDGAGGCPAALLLTGSGVSNRRVFTKAFCQSSFAMAGINDLAMMLAVSGLGLSCFSKRA